MMYYAYYGELSEAYRKDWNNDAENPFQVLTWHKNIEAPHWTAFLAEARALFRDEIQIDWGSFAWKADKAALLKMDQCHGFCVESAATLQSELEYGVVFIEMP